METKYTIQFMNNIKNELKNRTQVLTKFNNNQVLFVKNNTNSKPYCLYCYNNLTTRTVNEQIEGTCLRCLCKEWIIEYIDL